MRKCHTFAVTQLAIGPLSMPQRHWDCGVVLVRFCKLIIDLNKIIAWILAIYGLSDG
jgi:hypothetical protein